MHGTRRINEDVLADLQTVWDSNMGANGPMSVERRASALEKQFKRIRTGGHTFTSHYLDVKAMPTTGNLTEKDIISGAVTRYCSLFVFDTICTYVRKNKQKY